MIFNMSGGKGSPLQVGVIRPDAELIQTWTADEKIVEDLGLTLPAYATSAQTIQTGANLTPTITINRTAYNYYIVMRGLAIPIYNTETKRKGRCEYGASIYLYELTNIPSGDIQTLDGSKTITAVNQAVTANGSGGRELYWSSATAIGVVNSVTYGAYVTGQAPAISSTTLTIKEPNYGIRGNTSYMTSAAWAEITDIREQYVIEVYRAPKTDIEGWGLTSSLMSILEDVRNGGSLT